MIESLALLTSFWFVVLLAIVFTVAMVVAVDTESWIVASVVLVLSVFVFQFFTEFKVLSYLITNPLTVLMWAGVYVAAGVVWSLIKWSLYALRVKEKFDEYCVRKISEANVYNRLALEKGVLTERKPIPSREDLVSEWNRYKMSDNLPLNVKEYKGKITFWMFWWPWSALWTILDDPLRRFYNMLYNMFGGVFQKISDKIIGV